MRHAMSFGVCEKVSLYDRAAEVVLGAVLNTNTKIYESYITVPEKNWWRHPFLYGWNIQGDAEDCLIYAGGSNDGRGSRIQKLCTCVTNPYKDEMVSVGHAHTDVVASLKETIQEIVPVGGVVSLCQEEKPWFVSSHILRMEKGKVDLMVGLAHRMKHIFLPVRYALKHARPIAIQERVVVAA